MQGRLRPRVQHPVDPVSLTQQHQAKEADINNVVGRHLASGGTLNNLVDPRATRNPIFGNFVPGAMGFHEAQNLVIETQSKFDTLPARLRSKFNNDPFMMLRWLEDPRNLAEAQKLRLVPDPDSQDPFVEDPPEKPSATPPGPQGGASATPPAPPAGGPPPA